MEGAHKIGLGKDSHRFLSASELETGDCDSDKPLVIGGVVVPNAAPFRAHSDGDVLYHAVFNSIPSALGMRSIGHYFPDSDQAQRKRDSADYLLFIKQKLDEASAEVCNLSIVVECLRPKIDPIAEQIRSNLGEILDIKPEQVGLTATTGEGITPWGRGLGVEVTVTTLIRHDTL